ncbi:MAG: enoyl-CoA hydratase/isomerase family protein [Roseiarcus sp.]
MKSWPGSAEALSSTDVNAEPETRIQRRGCAGWITLNRPRALNALTLAMVREISAALDGFERDDRIAHVVIEGAGERAFCAGGDIRWLYERGRAGDHAAQLAFWREEYVLDRRIKRFSKPFVALIDGIVMGGGVGVSMHGAYRVAGDRAVFAMPEVGVGLFPDVGGTYFLPRLPRRLGVFLALTGLSARAGDMAALGLATSYTPSSRFSELAAALGDAVDVGAVLARFAAPPPPSRIWAEAEWIEKAFAGYDADEIGRQVAAAAAGGSELAAEARDALAKKSPTSQAIALEQMRIGGGLEFEAAIAVEFRIVSRVARGHDFYEGVRAIIIDKDNQPHWRPGAGESLPRAQIDAYFAPLPESEELDF